MTSNFAEFVLYAFIPLAIGMFFCIPPLRAALLVVLGGEMFLPEGPSFYIPLTPPWDKHNIIYVCVLLGCLLRRPGKVTRLPKERWFLLLSVLLLAGGLLTAATNSDPITFALAPRAGLPALTITDGMYGAIQAFIASSLPFYLGCVLVVSAHDFERLLVGFSVAGIVYCLFALVEVRLSPLWHYWIYGYGVGEHLQAIRWGGFRPTAFMPHGLALSRFLVATLMSLVVIGRTRRKLLGLPVHVLIWFHMVVLVLCKSTGAIILAAVGVPLIRFGKPKLRLLVAVILAGITLLYPLLRSMDLFPVTEILDAAGAIQEDRQGSLRFRFTNEDTILKRTRERILFGWGGSARNHVWDDYGRDIAVFDGYWIIILSVSGVLGFLCVFGTLLWPVILARKRLRTHGDSFERGAVSGLALILAVNTVDLIPNGLWSYYSFFLAGALSRRLRELAPAEKAIDPPT